MSDPYPVLTTVEESTRAAFEDRIRLLLATNGKLMADIADCIRREGEAEAEIERLKQDVEAAHFGARNKSSLSDAAIASIRDMLNEAGVPMAAFIDDHVGNAIVQRNEAIKRAEAAGADNARLRKAKASMETALKIKADEVRDLKEFSKIDANRAEAAEAKTAALVKVLVEVLAEYDRHAHDLRHDAATRGGYMFAAHIVRSALARHNEGQANGSE